MARRNLNAPQRAKNIAAGRPTRIIKKPDGTQLVDRLCSIPNNAKMVDPDGNVVRVPLATGYTIRGNENNWRDNPYGAQIWFEKLKKGFIPYDVCPLKPRAGYPDGLLPPDGPKDKPCEGEFDRQHCCPHIEKVIKARRAKKQKHERQYAKAFASNQDRMVAALEEAVLANRRDNGDPRRGGGNVPR